MRHEQFRSLAALLLTSSVAFAPQAFAATAGNADGARVLTDNLAAYVGRPIFDDKIITVTPDPAGYRILFDGTKLSGVMKSAVGKVDVGRYSLIVSENSDGTWSVSSKDGITAAFETTIAGTRTAATYELKPGGFEGVYSPDLGNFLSAKGNYSGGSLTTDDHQATIDARFGAVDYAMTAREVGEGEIDLTTKQTLANLSESIETQVDPAEPDERVAFTIDVKTLTMDGNAKAMRSRALADLWAFAIATESKDKLAARQAELKRLLTAALPLWKGFDGGYVMEDLAFAASEGSIGADRVLAHVGGGGLSSDADFRYRFAVTGLKVDVPAVPGWWRPLVPKDIEFGASVEGLDLEGPARIAIETLDLAAPMPFSPEAEARVAAAFAAKVPTVKFEGMRVKGTDYDLTASGTMSFETEQPTVTLAVEMAGLDTVIAALQKASQSDQTALQIVGPLSFAKGFAKTLPDGRAQWVLESAGDGGLKINGTQIVAPTPPEPQGSPENAPTDENNEPVPL